jgi:hypothetical protein
MNTFPTRSTKFQLRLTKRIESSLQIAHFGISPIYGRRHNIGSLRNHSSAGSVPESSMPPRRHTTCLKVFRCPVILLRKPTAFVAVRHVSESDCLRKIRGVVVGGYVVVKSFAMFRMWKSRFLLRLATNITCFPGTTSDADVSAILATSCSGTLFVQRIDWW